MARRSTRRRRLLSAVLTVLLAPALSLLAASAILVTDRQTGLLALARLGEEVSATRDELYAMRRERARLTGQIRRLRAQPLAIETAAREQLGMLRPGELVVRWPKGAPRAD